MQTQRTLFSLSSPAIVWLLLPLLTNDSACDAKGALRQTIGAEVRDERLRSSAGPHTPWPGRRGAAAGGKPIKTFLLSSGHGCGLINSPLPQRPDDTAQGSLPSLLDKAQGSIKAIIQGCVQCILQIKYEQPLAVLPSPRRIQESWDVFNTPGSLTAVDRVRVTILG